MFAIDAFYRSIRPRSCFNVALSFESICGPLAKWLVWHHATFSSIKWAIQSFAWRICFLEKSWSRGQHVRVLFSRPKGPLHSPSFPRHLHHRHHPLAAVVNHDRYSLLRLGPLQPLVPRLAIIACSTVIVDHHLLYVGIPNSTVTFSTGYSAVSS